MAQMKLVHINVSIQNLYFPCLDTEQSVFLHETMATFIKV